MVLHVLCMDQSEGPRQPGVDGDGLTLVQKGGLLFFSVIMVSFYVSVSSSYFFFLHFFPKDFKLVFFALMLIHGLATL